MRGYDFWPYGALFPYYRREAPKQSKKKKKKRRTCQFTRYGNNIFPTSVLFYTALLTARRFASAIRKFGVLEDLPQ